MCLYLLHFILFFILIGQSATPIPKRQVQVCLVRHLIVTFRIISPVYRSSCQKRKTIVSHIQPNNNTCHSHPTCPPNHRISYPLSSSLNPLSLPPFVHPVPLPVPLPPPPSHYQAASPMADPTTRPKSPPRPYPPARLHSFYPRTSSATTPTPRTPLAFLLVRLRALLHALLLATTTSSTSTSNSTSAPTTTHSPSSVSTLPDHGLPSTSKPSSLPHLPHLDGLRAVALLGVLLFHFEVPHTQGGFAGVDVFLSLSGFLITRNILRDLSAATFSLRRFYVRRFFRLYPAATVMVAASVTAAFLVFPDDLADSVAASALASMASVSNIFFHMQEGYFDSSAVLKPLLHTWSLSLEEQFYFLWAPLLVLISCFRRPLFIPLIIALLAILSLLAAAVLASALPSFVFYQLPPRIFQFAAGALLSTLPFDIPASRAADSVATAALSAIVLSFTLLPRGAGPLAMIPTTLGTCALIALPRTAIARHILADPVMRLMGRLSYSAYLVHWPLFVFARHVMSALALGSPPPVALFIITMALAWVLHRTVEQPARHAATRPRARLAVLALVLATASFCVLGMRTGGFSFRNHGLAGTGFPGRVGRSAPTFAMNCHNRVRDRNGVIVFCRVGDTTRGKRSSFVFFGDSFTHHLLIGLARIGRRRGEWYDMHFRTGCRFRPTSHRPSISSGSNSASKACTMAHDNMWNTVSNLPNGSTIVVSNSWWWKSTEAMWKTIRELDQDVRGKGHHLMLVEEPPGVSSSYASYFDCADLATMPLGRLWAMMTGRKYSGATVCANVEQGLPPFEGRDWQNEFYQEMFEGSFRHVGFVDLYNSMCSNSTSSGTSQVLCKLPASTDGIVYDIGYRRDLRHLNEAGSYYIADLIERQMYEEDDPPVTR